MKRNLLPLDLPLLPGLRWKGKLRVMELRDDGSACVAFDAESSDPNVFERFIFDRAVLTATQLEDWTGWTAEKPSSIPNAD